MKLNRLKQGKIGKNGGRKTTESREPCDRPTGDLDAPAATSLALSYSPTCGERNVASLKKLIAAYKPVI
ncbi:MAG: hypothetical protein ACM34A_11655 [Bacillota bacterium]